jgi:hypothetical protein
VKEPGVTRSPGGSGGSPRIYWCRVCGRRLTDPESIRRGIGPFCLERLKRPVYVEPVSPDKTGCTVDGGGLEVEL